MIDQRGFTLVETLVAFAIMAVMLTALLQTAGSSLRAIDSAAHHNRAVLVAQSQLDRIMALKQIPAIKEGRMPNSPYRWHVEEISSGKLPANVERMVATKPVFLRVSVSWKGARKEHTVSIERLIFVSRIGS
jgi:general secretion pathway protein I